MKACKFITSLMLQYVMVVAVLILVYPNPVHADQVKLPYSAQQIEDAMRANNWDKAEAELRAIIDVKPNSAKAWWMLAQCEEQLGHTVNARDYTTRAIGFDTSEKFASPGAPEALIRRLSTIQAQPLPPTDLPVRQVPQQVSHVSVQPPVIIQRAPEKPTDWTPLEYILIAGLLGIFVYFTFVFYNNKRKAKEEAERLEASRKIQFTRAVALQSRLTTLNKTILYETQATSELAMLVMSALTDVGQLITQLRNTSISDADLNSAKTTLVRFESSTSIYESRASSKKWNVEPPVVKDPTPTPSISGLSSVSNSGSHSFNKAGSGSIPPSTRTVIRETRVIERPGPTVVVNNTRNDDSLLTGVILGEELAQSRESERQRERDRDREEQSRRDREWSNPSPTPAPYYSAPTPSPSYSPSPAPVDFGGSSSYDSGSSSSGSSSSSDDF